MICSYKPKPKTNFFRNGYLVILRFQPHTSHLTHIVGPLGMFFHAHKKTITFIYIGILIILQYWYPFNLPKAHFRSSLYVFACTCKNHNFYQIGILVILHFWLPTGLSKAHLRASLHACMKPITFIEMSILVILHFQCLTGHRTTTFRTFLHVFARLCENHNFYGQGYFGKFSFQHPTGKYKTPFIAF